MLCNCFSVSMNDVRAFWKNLLHYSVFSKITGLLVDLWVVCFVFVVLSVGEKKVNLLEKSCLCQRRSTCSIIVFCHWSWPQPKHGALRQELDILFFSMLFPAFVFSCCRSFSEKAGGCDSQEWILFPLKLCFWRCASKTSISAVAVPSCVRCDCPRAKTPNLFGNCVKGRKKLWKHKNWERLGILTLSKWMSMNIKE